MWEFVKQSWNYDWSEVLGNFVVWFLSLLILQGTDHEYKTPKHLHFAVFQVPVWLVLEELVDCVLKSALFFSRWWNLKFSWFFQIRRCLTLSSASHMIFKEFIRVIEFNTLFILFWLNCFMSFYKSAVSILVSHEQSQHYNILDDKWFHICLIIF